MRSLAGRNRPDPLCRPRTDALECVVSRTADVFSGASSDVVKVIVRDRETIQEAVRRFGKLLMRSGLKKEMRRRKYYEKPSDIRRRARLRAQRRSLKSRLG